MGFLFGGLGVESLTPMKHGRVLGCSGAVPGT